MFCPECACQLPVVARFCVRCGSRISVVASAPEDSAPSVLQPQAQPERTSISAPDDSGFCRNCGARMEALHHFCTSCGQPTIAHSAQIANTPVPLANEHISVQPRASVGGWLLLFCIGHALLGPLLNISDAAASNSTADQVFAIAYAAYQLFVGITVWRGARHLFTNLKIYFIVSFCIGVLNVIVGFGDLQAQTEAASYSKSPFVIGIRDILGCLIWWLYFKRSKRVAQTFGRNL